MEAKKQILEEATLHSIGIIFLLLAFEVGKELAAQFDLYKLVTMLVLFAVGIACLVLDKFLQAARMIVSFDARRLALEGLAPWVALAAMIVIIIGLVLWFTNVPHGSPIPAVTAIALGVILLLISVFLWLSKEWD